MSAVTGEQDFCPYVGLQPFREEDRDYFFGRSRDQRVVISNLYASHLTVLYGPSGVGKSSILRAGVVPQLRTSPNTAVVVFSDWAHPRFQDELKRACIDAMARVKPEAAKLDSSLTFDALLQHGTATLRITLLVILDQFEEYFLYHPASAPGTSFDDEFARAVNSSDIDIGFLIALREDAVAKLDRFRGRIPGLLGNAIRLSHLDAQSAKEAILKPVESVYNERFPAFATSIEPELVDALIDEARGHQISATGGVGTVAGLDQFAGIETALLQLLLTKLWRAEPYVSGQRRVLRLKTFRDLGGAERVVERHLSDLMVVLAPGQLELCARIFDRLVTPSGSKLACSEPDLAKWAGDLAPQLPDVLHRLSTGESRILRPLAAAPGDVGGARYEIFHDVLAGAILAWRSAYLATKEQAELRLAAEEQRKRADAENLAASRLRRALTRARVFTAIAVIATLVALLAQQLAERANTRATTQALTRAALSHSRTDPELGVVLALHAVEAAKRLETDVVGKSVDALRRVIDADRPRSNQSKDADVLGEAVDALGRVVNADHLKSTQKVQGNLSSHPFSSDGKRLLVVDNDGRLQVQTWPDGRPEVPLQQDEGTKFYSARFSPTGRLIAAIADDMTVRIWNSKTGQQYPVLERQADGKAEPVALAISDDDSMIAVGGGYTAWVWRVGELKPFVTLGGHKDQRGSYFVVQSVAFHPHKPILATGAWDHTIRLWSLPTGKPLGVLKGHTAVIEDLEFSRDRDEIVSASQDGTARIWSTTNGQLLRSFDGHANSVFQASYSWDGKRIVTASADTTARVWDVASGRELALLPTLGLLNGARFDDEDRRVVSIGRDNTIKTWSTSGNTPVQVAKFSPDGRRVASAGGDAYIHLWDAVTGEQVQRLAGPRGAVQAFSFSADGHRFAAGDTEGQVILWDASTGQIVASKCCRPFPIEAIALSPDGSLLVSAAGSDGVTVWTVNDRQSETPLAGDSQTTVELVDFSPDGRWIAATGGDGTVWTWRVGTETDPTAWRMRESKGHNGQKIQVLRFSPDSKMLMTGGEDFNVILWNLESGEQRQLPSLHEAIVMGGVFMPPDGATVITCDIKGIIRVWDTRTLTPLPGPHAHTNMCTLELSATGDRLASFSWDRTVKVWDTKTWRQLATVTHREQVNGGSISPDGRHLATFTPYEDVRIVPLDVDELVRLAKTRLPQELSRPECERYLHQKDCALSP